MVMVEVVDTYEKAQQKASNAVSFNEATTGKKNGAVEIMRSNDPLVKEVLTVQPLAVNKETDVPVTAMLTVKNTAQDIINAWRLLRYISESADL